MQYSNRALPSIVSDYSEAVIKPNILNWERDRAAPKEIFKEAGKVGLLGLETAVASGGLGATFLDKIALAFQMSQYSMAVSFALINSQNIAARLSTSASLRHRNELAPKLRSGDLIGCTALTEPHAGSDFSAIQTQARKVDGGWLLTGSKAWITNAANADVIMLYAQTDAAKKGAGIASFLIEANRPGFSGGEIYNLIGGHVIGAGEFHLDNYLVADEDMLAPPGQAFKNALNSINGARSYVAAMCAGMLQNALNTAIRYGAERKAFGVPILSHQGLKWSLVDVAAQLEALKLLALEAGRKISAGENAVLSAAIAKKTAGEATIPALTSCIQAMGANGLKEGYLLGHHLACAKIAAYTDGSTEMMNERIATSLQLSRPSNSR